MPWLQLKFTVDADLADAVVQSLEDCGAQAVSLEDAGQQPPLFDLAQEGHPLWDQTRVIGWFTSGALAADLVTQISARLGRTLPPPEQALIADQDWVSTGRAHFKPLSFGGGRLWVCPSWHAPPEPDAVNVILDPGLAFGTGAHASTALCLEWLAAERLDDIELVDFGCGSGILGIAALKLGAARAWGVDIDPQALEVSRGNALRNHVSKRYLTLHPHALQDNLEVNVVIANILAEPLVSVAPILTRLVKPRGRLLLAGLLTDQTAPVRGAYMANFAFIEHRREDWALLVGTRKEA